MNRFTWLTWLSACVLSFMACTGLKKGDERPMGGGEGGEGNAAGTRGGAQQSGSGGSAKAGGSIGGGGGAGDGGGGNGGEPPSCDDPVETTGTTYYFCACDDGADPRCEAGSPLNGDGTNPSAPLLGYAAARDLFDTLKAGDTVAFCRGGAWDSDADARWSNPNCTAEKPCTIRDYQPSWDDDTAPRPRIDAGNGLGLHLFGGAGFRVLNLELTGKNQGISVEKYVSDVLMCGLVLDGFDRAVRLASGGGATNRITLRASTIRNTKGQAVGAIDPCNDCVVADNRFEQNGLAAIPPDFSVDTVAFSAVQPSRHIEIRNNVFHTESGPGAFCFGNSVVLDGTAATGALIEGNTVEETGSDKRIGGDCGRMVAGGSGTPVTGATIRGNRFLDVGPAGAYIQYCHGCVIENNIYSRSRTMNDPGGAELPFTPFVNNGTTDDFVFRNNTVFAAEGVKTAYALILGFYPNMPYPGFIGVNNLVLFRGTAATFDFIVVGPEKQFEVVDNNLCFFPHVPGGRWLDGSLADWRKTGFDVASLNEDPQIVETSGPTFLAPSSATSPIVGTGDPDHAPAKDIGGNDRDPLAPTIGAIEFAKP